MKNKLPFIFLTFTLLVLFVVPVYAAQPTVDFYNTEVLQNGTFDLYVDLNAVPEFCYATISLEYDGFEIMSYNSNVDNAVFGNNRRGELRVSIASSENYQVSGNLITLKCWTEFVDKIKFNGKVEEIGDITFKNDFTEKITKSANFTTASKCIGSCVTVYNSNSPWKQLIISYALGYAYLWGGTPCKASSIKFAPSQSPVLTMYCANCKYSGLPVSL